MTAIKPRTGFSLSSITADSRNIDTFGCDGFAEIYETERLEVVIPAPTPSDRKQYDMPRRGEWDQCNGADNYRDGFFPMMNALWPVELSYGRSEAEAAELMNKHAGATSLVTIDGDHYIAMTGGGMNLSWHIAAAYVCCGCVPPIYILDSLRGSPFRQSPTVNRAILSAGREAARHLQVKARRLVQDLRAIDPRRDGDKPRKAA